MRIVTASEIDGILTFPELIETLRTAFRGDYVVPGQCRHLIERPDEEDSNLVVMPAWSDFAKRDTVELGYVGVKLVTVFPENERRAMPSIMGIYVLMSGRTGEPIALLDGRTLTLWRTAAASALAARYLARNDAHRLLIVGAGALAPFLARAHMAVRPISEILVWNRSMDAARRLARHLAGFGVSAAATDDLEGAVRGADIVSCATMSERPLIRGTWLHPGHHIDLVGGFRPDMREADDDVMRRARIFVDTREGACRDAGDIVQPLGSGILTARDIAADLFELCRGEKAGRRFYDQITVFKSVGTAIEDLAAAEHVFLRT